MNLQGHSVKGVLFNFQVQQTHNTKSSPPGHLPAMSLSTQSESSQMGCTLSLYFNPVLVHQHFLNPVHRISTQLLRHSLHQRIFLDDTIHATVALFPFLPFLAVPCLVVSRSALISPAYKRSTTLPTEYFSVERMMPLAAPVDAGLIIRFSLFKDLLHSIPRFPVDDGLVVVRQVVRLVLPVWIGFLCDVISRRLLLKELVPYRLYSPWGVFSSIIRCTCRNVWRSMMGT